MITLRDLSPSCEKAAVVLSWLNQEWPNTPNSLSRITSDNKEVLPLTILAEEGPELVGFVSLIYLKVESRPSWHYWIDALVVASSQRGRGIASLLLASVASRAAKFNIDTIHARTGAARVYTKSGWQIIDHEDGLTYLKTDIARLEP